MKIIETGIDEIMKHLKKEGSSTVKDLSERFGYPEEVVEEWLRALEDHKAVDIDYGLRKTEVKIHEEGTKDQAKENIKKKKEGKHVCDVCGKSFDTDHGLKIHKAMVHEEGD